MNKTHEQVALIAGGLTGIGHAVAFAKKGAKVVVAGVDGGHRSSRSAVPSQLRLLLHTFLHHRAKGNRNDPAHS